MRRYKRGAPESKNGNSGALALRRALDAPAIPKVGDLHPIIRGLHVNNIRAALKPGNTGDVIVTCEYVYSPVEGPIGWLPPLSENDIAVFPKAVRQPMIWAKPFIYGMAFLLLLWACMAWEKWVGGLNL